MTVDSWDLLVRRDDLHQRRVAPGAEADAPLAPGQIRVRVDRFALTANNVTYAVVGEQVGYWRFFPAPEGWGRVPVWGFAEVVESAHPELAPGERLYGYWPMSTHAVLTVGRLTPAALTEGSEHRRALPGAYNQYLRIGAREPGQEDATALLRPLFTTAFLLDDQLADAGFHGAAAVVLTSASSKTALGLAGLLHARENRPRVIGLTSAANHRFVEGLGTYDQVLAYDDLSALDALASAAAVDFAGRDALTAEIHDRLDERLKLSLKVGVTHWEAGRGGPPPAQGPAPVWFFAPDRIKARSAEWGRDGFEARLAEAWAAFVPSTAAWLRVAYADGPEALDAVWGRFLAGAADPAEGVVARPGGPR